MILEVSAAQHTAELMYSLSGCIYSMQQPDTPQQAELLFSVMGTP